MSESLESISRKRISAFLDAFYNGDPIIINEVEHRIVSHETEPVYRSVRHKFVTDGGVEFDEVSMFGCEANQA